MSQVIQPYEIIQGNYGQKLDFTIVDGEGNAVDLTGASIALKVQNSQDENQTLLTLNGSVSIDDAAAGKCHYTVGQDDFATPGKYLGELVISVSGVSSISAPGIVIIVYPTLPRTNN